MAEGDAGSGQDPSAQQTQAGDAGTGTAPAAAGQDASAALKAEADKLRAQLKNAQSVIGRQSNELGVLRRQAGLGGQGAVGMQAMDYGQQYQQDNSGYQMQPQYNPYQQSMGYADQSAGYQVQPQRQALDPETAMRLDMIQFRQDYPDAVKSWEKVMEIMNDPIQAAEIASFRQDGMPNYYASFKNALRQVENASFREQAKEWEAARAQQQQQREAVNQQAFMSGLPVTESGETQTYTMEDIDKMSAKEMQEKGLVTVDQDDLPSFAQGGGRSTR